MKSVHAARWHGKHNSETFKSHLAALNTWVKLKQQKRCISVGEAFSIIWDGARHGHPFRGHKSNIFICITITIISYTHTLREDETLGDYLFDSRPEWYFNMFWGEDDEDNQVEQSRIIIFALVLCHNVFGLEMLLTWESDGSSFYIQIISALYNCFKICSAFFVFDISCLEWPGLPTCKVSSVYYYWLYNCRARWILLSSDFLCHVMPCHTIYQAEVFTNTQRL